MSLILLSRRRGAVSGGGGGILAPDFEDTFTGLQLNPSGGLVYSNENGTLDFGSIVTFDGVPCVRFNYSSSVVRSQLNYTLPNYVTEYAKQFQLHIPSNFTMAYPPIGNNKFWQVWRDGYSSAGGGDQQVGMEYQIFNSPARAEAFLKAMCRSNAGMGFNLITDFPGNPSQDSLMISASGPLVIGAWNDIKVYIKGSSAFGVNDGIYKVWLNDVLAVNITNGPIYNYTSTPADVKFRKGYVMGEANTGWAASTPFHMRLLRFWYDKFPGWT